MSEKDYQEQRMDEQNSEAQNDDTEQKRQDGPSGGSDDAGELSLEQALERLEEAENTAAKQHDEVLRVRAEMQNVQRRSEMAVEKAHKYGQERFAGEILVVVDNLERTLDAVQNKDNEAVRPLYEGVELTLKSLMDALRKFNIEQLDPEGEPFDPQQHEAMTMQENPDVEPNSVVAVMQKGYTLNGRVIRPARVIVARAPSAGVDEKV